MSLSTYPDADQHGPAPVPDWVITTGNALDTEVGLLKTGKEAEVFVVERRSADGRHRALLAHKRYLPTPSRPVVR